MKLTLPTLAASLLLLSSLTGFAQTTAAPSAPPSLLVAAASDLQFVLPDLIQLYSTSHPGTNIGTTYGSSGKFFAQIQNGAPFDLFLSADASLPRKLIEAGQGDEADFFLYAIGRIVVWTPKNSPLDFQKNGLQSLLDPSVKKIAIANPEHTPYGRAAVAALQKLGVYDQVKDRLVLGENVVQAAQFVQTGAAEAGFLALSLALADPLKKEGQYWEVPLDAYPKLEQGAVVLKQGPHAVDARQFSLWLRGSEALPLWKKYGFELPR